jgi:pimeloyl-ACP methyl ester carboxylesterase
MSEATVRGVTLNYRVFGTDGPWIAFTPGSRRGFGELVSLAERMAAAGYRVLLHDRRNCGASDVGVEPTGSEHEIWADDLDALCRQLGAYPICAGGSSAGARLALLFALRHRDIASGLLLWRVTGGAHAAEKLSQQYYGDFIALAEKGGMEAVCASDHFAECIRARPSNRDRLMGMSPKAFIDTMAMWRKRFLQDADLPVVGATEADLQSLTIPVCLIAGNDKVHTPIAAQKAHRLIANSELVDDVVEKRPENDLLPTWDQADWFSKEPRIAEVFLSFLKRHPPAAR